jgi:outer membrane protein TolC
LQAALAGVRLALHQARAGQAQARAGLVAYLGLAPDARIEPREDRLTVVQTFAAPAHRLSASALERRPELDALEQGARAYDSLAAAERAGNLPDVFVMAFATGAYTPGRDLVESRYVVDPLYHFDPGILLGMRWQIQGATASGRSDQRRAQARELRFVKSWAVAGLPAQVEKASQDAERARKDISEARTGANRAKKWMVQANADYVMGLADSQAFVDSTRAYAELRAAELDAMFRYNLAMAELAHATGTIVGDGLGLYPGKEAR